MIRLNIGAQGLFAAMGIAFLLKHYLTTAGATREVTRGKLESLSLQERCFTVRVPGLPEQTFQWDQATSFYNLDGPVGPEALQVGQLICTVFERKHLATRIEIEPVYGSQVESEQQA
jgi:hypothetical protein